MLEINKLMEFQVKFCLHSGLRLWRTEILFSEAKEAIEVIEASDVIMSVEVIEAT